MDPSTLKLIFYTIYFHTLVPKQLCSSQQPWKKSNIQVHMSLLAVH